MDRMVLCSCALATALLLGGCAQSAEQPADALGSDAPAGQAKTPSAEDGPDESFTGSGEEPGGEGVVGSHSASGDRDPSPRPSSATATPPAADTTPAPSASATGTRDAGAEVLPPTPSSTGLPGLLPPVDTTAPLVTRPFPPTAVAQGRLVKGYPVAVLPLVDRSRVLTSSVSPAQRSLQVSLTATTRTDPDEVAGYYSVRLGRLGFREKPASAVAGSSARAFSRGRNTVLLTVTPGSVTSYSLVGSFSALD